MDINFSTLTDLNILFVLNTILSLFFVYLLVKSNASYAKKMVVVPLIIFYMFYSLFTVSNLMGYPYRTEEPVAEFFMIGYKVEMHNDEKRIVLWAHPVGSEKSRLYSLPYEGQMHQQLAEHTAKKRKNKQSQSSLMQIKKKLIPLQGPKLTLEIQQINLHEVIEKPDHTD